MFAVKDKWTFAETHPWLKFDINLAAAGASFWMLLGEARSKCDHIAGVPLSPEIADAMHQIYLARGALATTAIEGNTLSEDQVRRFLKGELRLPPSQEYLGREIENIINACNEIVADAHEDGVASCSVDWFKAMNLKVLDGLSVAGEVVPGEIRHHSVGVGRYRGAPADECEYLLQRLCEWLNSDDFKAPAGLEIPYGIIKAALAHVYFAWIHPFGDGNGRTARLLEFKLLVLSGLPTPACHLLSNHYNLTKSEYYRQLDAASQSGGDLLPFLKYAVQGFVDGVREQIDQIRKHQVEVAWINYVHESFKDMNTTTDNRRRQLVLELSRQDAPVPIAQVTAMSGRLALAYADKTQRTLARDLNELWRMGLIVRFRGRITANRGKILAFLPWRNHEAMSDPGI